jgi:heme-degrading monooxygenase HmoA
MFAVVNHLHFNRPVEEFGGPVADSGLPLLSSLPGFRDFYFIKEGEDRGIIIIIWDDGPSAAAGAQAFGPTWFAEHFAPHLASPQQRIAGEVLASYRE